MIQNELPVSEKKHIAKSKRLVKEIQEHISFYLSIGLLLMLFSSFVYNLGYLGPLDLKLLGVLSIRDYYEGTTPYIVLFSSTPLLGYLAYLYLAKKTFSITSIFNIFVKDCSILIEIISMFFRLIWNKIKIYHSYYKLSGTHKKLSRKLFNAALKDQKQLEARLKRVFKGSLTIIGYLTFAFVLVAPPLILLLNNFKIVPLKAKLYFGIIILSLYQILKGSGKGKLFFFVIFSMIIVFVAGINTVKDDYRSENIQLEFSNDSRIYYLIRSISNGYIVRRDKDIYFFPKESLTQMKIEVTKKETNNDTK